MIKTQEYQGHQDQRWGHISFAQHGDDFMLINLFELLGVVCPRYLDLGAHHPDTISNTKLLYERGSRGVNVEANPHMIEAFFRERPEDTTVNCGVSRMPGSANFFMYDDRSGRNTFSSTEVQALRHEREVVKAIPTTMKTFDQIVLEFMHGRLPELLTVDIEGLDFDVLSSANLGQGELMVICVETRAHETGRMKAMLDRKGFFCYCRMGENLFFVHKNYRGKVY